MKAEVSGVGIVIVLHKGKVYALDSACTHEKGPLDEGSIDNDEIVCPWHAGAYHLDTGKADENTPWVHDTRSYAVGTSDDGELFIDL